MKTTFEIVLVFLLFFLTSCSSLKAMEWFPKGGEPKAEEMTDTSKMAEFGEKTAYKVLPEECLYGQVSRDGKCTECKSDDECVSQYPESRYPGATGTCNETKQKDGTTIKRCGCPLVNAGLMCGSGLVCDEGERYCRFCTSDDECLVAYGSENFCDKRSGGQGYCVGKGATTGVSQQFGVRLPCDEMDKIKDPRYKKYVAEECKKLYSGLPKANPSQLPSMARPSVLPPPQYQAPKPVDIWGLRNVIYSSDVAVDSKGMIYVTDWIGDTVQIFDQSGSVKGKFLIRLTGGLNCEPKLIAIDTNDRIYVVCDRNEIQIYDSSLKFVKAFNASSNVYDMDIDASGNIYAANSSTNKIDIYDSNGTYLRSFGKLGYSPGEITEPRGVAIDKKRKQIYVLSSSATPETVIIYDKIQLFDFNGKFIRTVKMARDVHFSSIVYDEVEDKLYASTYGAGIVTDKGYSFCLYDKYDEANWSHMAVFGGKYLYAMNWYNMNSPSLMAIDLNLSLTPNSRPYLWVVGGAGNGIDKVEFNSPVSITVNKGYVFIADRGNYRILKIDPTNEKVLMVIDDKLTGRTAGFESVAVNSSGDIYVAVYSVDKRHGSVRIYDPNGQLKKVFSAIGNGLNLTHPEYVMVDAANNVYVIDRAGDLIYVFDANGNFKTSFGKTGSSDSEFKSPEAMTTDSHGNIAVLDCMNNRIQFFTSQFSQGRMNFQFKAKVQIPYALGGDCRYADFAIDGNDLMYVVDSHVDSVKAFDINGKTQFEFGTPISQAKNPLYKDPGDFRFLRGIAIDRATGTIYVTDLSNVHVFK